jgi:hypothetical protein
MKRSSNTEINIKKTMLDIKKKRAVGLSLTKKNRGKPTATPWRKENMIKPI